MIRPRLVHPRDLEPGDKIDWTAPPQAGLTMSYNARVRILGNHGRTFYWKTQEGATIVKWDEADTKTRVLLLDREPVAQTMLNGVFPESAPEASGAVLAWL